MYTPKHFQAEDKKLIEQVVRENSFGLLVTATETGPKMTHMPFLYEAQGGEHGTLRGHMARANDHWKFFGEGDSAAVFMRPHAYVSPTWYREHQSVPTWNYAAVHMQGPLRILDEAGSLTLLLDITRAFEGPDTVYDFEAGEAYAHKSLSGIVAFEIPVGSMNAKFKMSQNKPTGDRDRVIARLAESPDPLAKATANFMILLGG